LTDPHPKFGCGCIECRVREASRADGRATQQCVLSFEWPGMQIGPGTFRFDDVGEKPGVSISNGDLSAWNAWRAAI